MYRYETKVRVRYGETDQMGYVYYGWYAQYFEVARVEMLRSLGISYREMETAGVMLPVLDFSIKYIKPALFDDELTIAIIVKEIPKVRIHFEYETKNAAGELLNVGETTLVFVDRKTGKPCAAPTEFVRELEKKFDKC